MSGIIKFIGVISMLFLAASMTFAAGESSTEESSTEEKNARAVVNGLQEPLYNPFVERYVLDELKQLRSEQAATKNELIQQILDREHHSVDRAVAYATDTVTYFFYLIAAASSVLVLIGWTSIRDIKERVHSLADREISNLVNEYELRLESIEKQLMQKTQHIEENREEIGLTQEIQSLWLRAQQETSPANKIEVYDQILKIRQDDFEALTYKADAVLELNEPQWAISLCLQALKIDPEDGHAFYQLACAYTAIKQFDDAIVYLNKALACSESYRQQIMDDEALKPLVDVPAFQELLSSTT